LKQFITDSIPVRGDAEIISMKQRRNSVKKVGILLIALALFIAGIAMADSGIEATPQISSMGADSAAITSTGTISGSGDSPAFSNMVESGSSSTMNVVNSRTGTNNRFAVGAVTMPSSTDHFLRLAALANTPSVGRVSAFMNGITQEASGTSGLVEQVEFSQRTTVDGQITLFEMNMHWESGVGRV
jgi:hypothetical protein